MLLKNGSAWIVMVSVMALGVLAEEKVKATKVGDVVPDVSAMDENGKEVKLSSFKGKSGVVLFFYPKADTPGCTVESCGFSKDAKAFADKGYVLLGASADSPADQLKFHDKYKMEINLLSDPKGELAGTFGFEPRKRHTVVIGKDGKVERIYLTVKPAEHVAEVLKDLGAK